MDNTCYNNGVLLDEVEDSTYYLIGSRNMASTLPGEEVVITGISGSFPNSSNIHEFKHNLFNKVNMVSPNRRFDCVHPEIPSCSGTLPEINKYDSGFFGVHENQTYSLDISARLLQEKAVEAIFDAGLHPSDLESLNTGVFIGTTLNECELWHFDLLQQSGITGSEKSMLARRLSYFLKLKGPSYTLDTGCSSSLYALEHAYRAIRLGEIDAAIIGGANLCLNPLTIMHFSRLGALAKNSVSKPFDIEGRGYVRSETTCCLLLQKLKDAKRMYAQVVHVNTNSDGFKEEGITFPSSSAQKNLLETFYNERFIDVNNLSYVEAHGTGTLAGDIQECASIESALVQHRKQPLLIGSVKSNMGHSEPASGVSSLTKCIIALETGLIPPNINFNTPKKELKAIIEGKMKVVVDVTPLDGNGLIGINNFGFGGTNGHILLKWNTKKKINNSPLKFGLPILVCVSGRTKDSIEVLLDSIAHHIIDNEFIALLHEVFRKNINNHLYRGYTVISGTGKIGRSLKYFSRQNRPLYFSFNELNNWSDIGCQLLSLHIFENFIKRVGNILSGKGIDIYNILLKRNPQGRNINILGNIVVQLGVLHILTLLELKPHASFGFLFGKLISAYCSGTLNLEKTVNYAFALNEIITNKHSYEKSNKFQDFSNNITVECDTVDLAALDKFENYLKVTELSNFESNIKNIFQINTFQELNIQNLDSVILQIGSHSFEVKDCSKILVFAKESDNYTEELLNCLGRLYEFGYSPQISKLYLPVAFPVSRGTTMISPYIKWNHIKEKFVPKFGLRPAQPSKYDSIHYQITVTENQWKHLTQHVIDGRNLFPATSYLYIVWETLLLNQDKSLNETQVVFENCRFIRATIIPKTGNISLNVQIQRGTGKFEIFEGNNAVVAGRIFLPNDDISFNLGKDFHQVALQTKSDYNLLMKSTDIYKEFQLRGYNYSGQYRGIENSAVDFSEGLIRWENKWDIFFDNMIQLKVLQQDSRRLFVPIFISKIIISPKNHLSTINSKICDSQTPTVSVYCDKFSDHIRSYGIDISGIKLKSISRRKDLAKPILEKYKFVPNAVVLDIYQSIRINIQIIVENSLMHQIKAVELIDEFTDENGVPLTPLIKLALEDLPLVQPFLKILSKYPIETSVETESKNLSSEFHCLLVIATNILERKHVLDSAFNALRCNGFIISRENVLYDYRSMKNPTISIISVHKTLTETILLLQKKTEVIEQKYIKISSHTDFSWIQKVQKAMKKHENIVLYSEMDPTNGILGLLNCLRLEPNGKHIRCVSLIDKNIEFDPQQPIFADQLQKNMAINIYKDKQWGTYRHLPLEKQCYVESEHRFVDIGVTGDLTTIKWLQGSLSSDSIIPSEKILVHVYYAALNFKDVLIATGKINNNANTTDQQEYTQGVEFSGIDSRGERVMGWTGFGAISTLVLADTYFTYKVPTSWSLEEAATVPVAYVTALYALIISARMKRGETILIHSGAGAVGQAAICLSLYYGCTVFTTVGTEEKRKFLKEKFPQIKDHQIGNSHDETFEQLIYKETRGRGVDMGLNSLTNDKLTASVRCLARGGRLLEIGRSDLENNNHLNLLLFQKEISYYGIIADQLLKETTFVKMKLSKLFADVLNKGIIKPIKLTVFQHCEIEQSYRFMASGKHIGKVLIQIREPENQLVIQPCTKKLSCVSRYTCNPEKTYIIIGGLGGMGLELTNWLILRGARKIVLNSRKGVKKGYQEMKIRKWRSYGTLVKVSTNSIITKGGCKQLIEESLQYGPIDGIFNLAVVIKDSIFENQSPESFQMAMDPKATATTYLDELTRKMCPDLSNFVVFSSLSCGRGREGQTSYGMSNSVMERICENRKENGYPALAIQWGPVGEVGLLTELFEENKEIIISGASQQKISSCLQMMDVLLGQKDEAVVSSIILNKKGKKNINNNIVDAVMNILGVTDTKTISHYASLAELGMDSISGIEIRQLLEREFDVYLQSKELRSMTISGLKEINKKYSVSLNPKKE